MGPYPIREFIVPVKFQGGQDCEQDSRGRRLDDVAGQRQHTLSLSPKPKHRDFERHMPPRDEG